MRPDLCPDNLTESTEMLQTYYQLINSLDLGRELWAELRWTGVGVRRWGGGGGGGVAAAASGLVKGLNWKGNEGSNPLSAYNVMSQPRLMESIWGGRRYGEKEGGGLEVHKCSWKKGSAGGLRGDFLKTLLPALTPDKHAFSSCFTRIPDYNFVQLLNVALHHGSVLQWSSRLQMRLFLSKTELVLMLSEWLYLRPVVQDNSWTAKLR